MKQLKERVVLAFFCLSVICVGGTQAIAEGISKKQGDEILKELKTIRTLLQHNNNIVQQQKAVAIPEKVEVSINAGASLGKNDAPLVLVEFTDYQCPFCKRFYDNTFPELKKQYIDSGKLRFISRNLPLKFHKNAESAALAAACANDQNKYWKMRKFLFSDPNKLEPDNITIYAKQSGLNMESFNTCMTKRLHSQTIQKDIAAARAVGVSGTPSFVLAKNDGDIVEGEKIIGAQPFSILNDKIQRLLK